MKRKFVVFALIISAFVSVTSGCIVREGYDHPYHHDHERYHHDHDDREHDEHGD